MKKTGIIILMCIASLTAMNNNCFGQDTAKHAHKKIAKGDTTGMADIEDRLDDFKTITGDITNKLNKCGNLDSIKRFVSIVNQLSDTILNHIAPIFDGFLMQHPEQYPSLKNISDLTDRMLDCKKIDKAKKYSQQLGMEYTNLAKAK